ncbi:MAG: tetratricopeptide (TPR) repeat protein, partial [Planctomycetota bacterium]
DGRWIEGAEAAGVARAGWAWGSVFADLDNDGDQDLFVTNGFTTHSERSLPDWQPWFWRQVLDDAGALQDGRQSRDANTKVGAFRGSFNGNERDHYYHNPDGASGRFVDAAYVRGLDLASDGRSVVPVDVDGDGDLDLALWTLQGLELFENTAAVGGFVRIELVGKGGAAGSLGALVRVRSAGREQRQMQRLVDGFQSQVPGHLHFGLGSPTRIDELHVRWPSGLEQSWSDLPANSLLRLHEGQTEAERRELPTWPAASRPRGTAPSATTFAKRLGSGPEALASPDQNLLLHLAADAASPWPEAAALRAAHPELRLVQLLPPDEFQSARSNAHYASFELDADLAQQLFGKATPVRPASFLFDVDGRLTRAFLRPVTLPELQAILQELEDEAPFPELLVQAGRRALSEGRFREARELFLGAVSDGAGEPAAYDGLARAHRLLGRPDLAEDAYRSSLTLDPDYALGHFNLGSTLVAREAFQEAVLAYQQALRIHPDDLRAHLALAETLLHMLDLEGATDAFKQALVHVPAEDLQERTAVMLDLGRLLGQRRQLDEATLVLEEVLTLDPGNVPAKRALDLIQRLQQQSRQR